ncbi:Lipopolysaccharide export system permease protein LptF [Candidatus Profftia lariciata]|uniref:LPS export ABC transporter permease LptF n=1 Tax=Candidatus Profftia lariciata TaxID=1987921 RepID=UPI001D01C96C|nr:LPS export ABC transporter permease LptF [Candidatus Profftia lariciata]UDG81420.1 Lipopolysaccharide export system permease protein LptF [Candidatus Profftia lariciata]
MIIIKYLIRETLKNQIAILFILLLIFFCQKMVRVLSAAVNGEIPINLILPLLGLGVPELAQLILPLSLFLSLLMTLSKMYAYSEIVVMHACGFSKIVLIKTAMFLACITGSFALVNVFWVNPWSSLYACKVIAKAKTNPSLTSIVEGHFQTSKNGNYVLFIGNIKGNYFKNVFLAQLYPQGIQRPFVIVADTGHIQEFSNNFQQVVLDTGTRYEGTVLLRNFHITNFINYKAIIGYQAVSLRPSNADQATMNQLWNSQESSFRAELHWRLTLIFSVFVMALIVVAINDVYQCQGRILSMLPAMLLYLIFFLLQSYQRSIASKGYIDPFIRIWAVNIFYFFLAMMLNIWDTLFMRKIRVVIFSKRD